MTPPTGVPAPSSIAPGTRIRLRLPELEDAVGIEIAPATHGALDTAVETTARIDFNLNATADVRTILPGIVQEVTIDLGQMVSAGDALFTLESVGIADLQARRRAARERAETARANLERQQELRASAINSERDVELANQELEAAQADRQAIEQSLEIVGAPRSGSSGQFTITAPIGGSVVRRPALVGLFASESESLATIADTSTMWALLDVPEWDAATVAIGQSVEVQVDGVPGRVFTGTVTWLASEVSTRTRTVRARVELLNPDSVLRAGQFARATVQIATPVDSLTVPLDAIQRLGDESVVFVRTSTGVYEPRVVQLGRSNGRVGQVEGEISAGDMVVTTGAYLLRTELSRESIGAGCCEVEAPGAD